MLSEDYAESCGTGVVPFEVSSGTPLSVRAIYVSGTLFGGVLHPHGAVTAPFKFANSQHASSGNDMKDFEFYGTLEDLGI